MTSIRTTAAALFGTLLIAFVSVMAAVGPAMQSGPFA